MSEVLMQSEVALNRQHDKCGKAGTNLGAGSQRVTGDFDLCTIVHHQEQCIMNILASWSFVKDLHTTGKFGLEQVRDGTTSQAARCHHLCGFADMNGMHSQVTCLLP